ncbi:trichohyalin-like [Mercenaria mercenaria]|uniref:trichohyalin-like n=1 Tax=Mercenaria mercenaria TaxID=6596 RepID=UPI00234F5930|nr:trichohyalin-like [Mercenaria mercenaria]
MSSDATTREIIDKLDSIFGNVRSGESVLSEFYMSRQKRSETISEWALRLEGILQRAIVKGHVKEDQKDEMLKVRFWRHLYSDDLKNATRLCFETAKSFEELRRKVRIEENEMSAARETEIESTDKVTVNQHLEEDDQSTVMKVILERIKSLEEQLLRLQEKDKECTDRPEREEDRYLDRQPRMSRYDDRGRERDRYDRYDRRNRRNYTDRYKDYEYRNRGHEKDYSNRFDRYDRNREGTDRYGRRFYGRERKVSDTSDRFRDTSERYGKRDFTDGNHRREERYGFDRERRFSDRIDTRFKDREERDTDRDWYMKREDRDNDTTENRTEMRKEENDRNSTPKQDNKQPLKQQQQQKPDTTNKANFSKNLNR